VVHLVIVRWNITSEIEGKRVSKYDAHRWGPSLYERRREPAIQKQNLLLIFLSVVAG